MFRTADGAGVRKLHLAGITTTPEHPKAAKTALGAESVVAWKYHRNAVDAAFELREEGAQLWAIEDTPQATPLFDTTAELPGSTIVLVVGNELVGVDPGILEACERTVRIPMQGVKRSLNVAVAFGVAAYYLRFGLPIHDDRAVVPGNTAMART
jgi:tRNA G18 (ribose-2'-O)-methylase SpoU